jgi:gliding motility-associated-like protein
MISRNPNRPAGCKLSIVIVAILVCINMAGTLQPVSAAIPVECFTYRRAVTINSSMVSGTANLTNFPVLIKVQDATLRHIYHGGRITHYKGYDILFTLNADGTGILKHQLDTYDPVSGTFYVWVNLPVLSYSANTTIYFFYSNYNITTDNSTDSVWSKDYVGVLHMGESIDDFGLAGNDGTNYGTEVRTGKIGNGRKFVRSDRDFIEMANEPAFRFDTTMSFSMWMYLDSFPQTQPWMDIIVKGDNANWRLVGNTANQNLYFAFGTGGTEGGHTCDLASSNNTIHLNQWHYIAGTWDGKQNSGGNHGLKRLYIDGTRWEQWAQAYSIYNYTTNIEAVLMGINEEAVDRRAFSGILDEVRVSNAFKPDNWVRTEYNNQNNPGAYTTLGAETQIKVLTPVGGTATAQKHSLFAREYTQLDLTGYSGAIQWQFSSDNINFNNSIGDNAPAFVTDPLMETNYFRALVSAGGCSVTSTPDSVIVNPGFIDCDYDYRKRITIPPDKVYGNDDLQNFPVLVKIINDNDLKSVSQGGKVSSGLGYDLAFASSNGVTLLMHEVESYDSTTGSLAAWVRVTDLKATDTTTLFLYYGNPSIKTNPSTSATWSSNFIGVWHMGNDLTDATGKGNNGTDNGTSVTGGTIGSSRSFNGTSNFITLANESNFDVPTNGKLTISAWIYVNSYTGNVQFINKGTNAWRLDRNGTTGTDPEMYHQYSGGGNYLQAINTGGLATGGWHYLTATFDHEVNNMVVYIDGDASQSSKNDPASSTMVQNDNQVRFGATAGTASNYFNGRLDEVRIQNVFRSSDWVKSEYQNQSSPLTFISVHKEESCFLDPVPGTASSKYSKVCMGQFARINLTGYSGSIYWQSSPDHINWSYMPGQGKPVLIVGPLTDTMYYRASVSGCCEVYSNEIRIDYIGVLPPSLTYLIDSVSCVGGTDGAIDLTISNGSPPINVLWSTGSTNQDISGLTTGYYSLTVTDNALCKVIDSVDVLVKHDVTIPLVIFCPSDTIKNTVGGTCTANINPKDPVFSDNCGITRIIWSMSGATIDNSPATGFNYLSNYSFNLDTTRIIYTAYDSAGNFTTCTSRVIVKDNEVPVVVSCPADILRSSSASGCDTTFDPDDPVFSDNCTLSKVTWVMSGATTGSSAATGINYIGSTPFNHDTTLVVYTAGDLGGNTTTCSFRVIVNDMQKPTFSCVSNQIKFADAGECYYTVSGTEFDPTLVTDNCGIGSITNNMNGSASLAGEHLSSGTTILWTVKDLNGNIDTGSFSITVKDTLQPSILCQANKGQCADDNIGAQVTGLTPVSFSDNCTSQGALLVTFNISGVTTASGNDDASGEFFNIGLSTVTYTVLDEAGNSATCSTDVTVNPLPNTSSIIGDSLPICNASNEIYSVNFNASSKYLWSVPSASSIISDTTGLGKNSITVDFGTNSGDISVSEIDILGCRGNPQTMTISLQGCTILPDFIADKTEICPGDTVIFTDASSGVGLSPVYEWNFGTAAQPSASSTKGPHKVVYSSPGNKTVQLSITAGGVTGTTVKTDFIKVDPTPEVTIEDQTRCGDGEILFTALPTNANIVDFSSDHGLSILSSDNTSPYQQSVMLNAGENIEIWVKGINSTTGCASSWTNSANGAANLVPVTGAIIVIEGSGGNNNLFDVACRNEDHKYGIDLQSGSQYKWNIAALGVNNYVANEINAHWNLPQGFYQLSVQETSAAGCAGSISNALVWVADPIVSLGSDVDLCAGATHLFSGIGNFSSYQWNDGSNSPEYTASSEGIVWVKVKDQYGCGASDSALVSLFANPVLDLGNDTSLCGEATYKIDVEGFDAYEWSTGATSNSITLDPKSGTVSLTVTDDHGCKATDEIKVTECNPEVLFDKITNAFTPNNDNVHDTWVINNIDLFPDAKIEVFDKWGRLVYSVNGGYKNDWDGTSNGKKLPMDTYYYIIDFKSDALKPKKGTVTIVR